MSRSILVVDDDAAILRSYSRVLSGAGYDVKTAAGGAKAIDELDKRVFDLTLCDLSMPDVDGMTVLGHAMRHQRSHAAVMITGDGTIPLAVKAIRVGASDFLSKPVDAQQLLGVVQRTLGSANDENLRTEITNWRATYAPQIVGDDPALFEIFHIIERVADTECSVLVTGPSGTGKELIARTVHNASNRADKPFVAMNCAAIPKELMESEIFGHAKGAFTGATERRPGRFQVADGGSLFLDEIGELDLELQGKFLRVLQEGEVTAVGESKSRRVDVRIIAATNQDLEARVRDGQFREDLYYRLNVIPVELPALKDRPGDIVPLAEHFIAKAAGRYNRPVSGLTDPARDAVLAYEWPGNVRELENLFERVVILKREPGPVDKADLPSNVSKIANEPATGAVSSLPEEGLDIRKTLEQVEIRLTRDAMTRAEGNKAKAAELLGLKRTTLIERLKRLGLE